MAEVCGTRLDDTADNSLKGTDGGDTLYRYTGCLSTATPTGPASIEETPITT